MSIRTATPPMTNAAAVLRHLAAAARRAPSGDNLQPWRFDLDPQQSRIDVIVAQERDASAMNYGQRMSRIAVGAALENILQTAEVNGLRTAHEMHAGGMRASVAVLDSPRGELSNDEAIENRCTNRRVYDGTRMSPEEQSALANHSSPDDEVSIRWVFDDGTKVRLGQLIQQADTLLFSLPLFRNAFLENVRFDAPPNAAVDEGLSLGSLEVGKSEQAAFRMLPKLPVWLLQALRVGRTFAKRTPDLIGSAAGLCLGFARDNGPETDLLVGRAMQSAWLQLTRRGLAVQPMMSLLVLHNALQHGPPEVIAELERRFLPIWKQVGSLGLSPPGARLAFVLRFGHAPPPTGRTGRRPV